MAEYFNQEEAAEVLGLSPAEVNTMRERNELRGFRDGASWKFKKEDVQNTLAEQIKSKSAPGDDNPSSDILLSEAELGESDPGASGTVIGPSIGASESSDVNLGGSDLKLGGSDAASVDVNAKVDDMNDLDLTLDEDLSLDDSQVGPLGGSAVDLSGAAEGLDDDDLVLGGSGSGSDITIGGDSGISLVDPADSGLSLDDPLELGGGEESLELGEDDMLTLSEDADTESPTELKTDDDFLLTPLEDASDDDSESGSQVIALDEALDPDAAMASNGVPVTPMLDEEIPGPGLGLGAAAMGAAPLGAATGPMMTPAQTAALPEAPYSVWNILSLALCAILLCFTGMMLFDLVRNMWSWGGAYEVNSTIMDSILSLFE